MFLYKAVLERDLPWFDGLVRAKRPVRIPAVLSEAEVRGLLERLHGVAWIMASLLYGAGLRPRECLKRRVKDIDFDYRQIIVRDGKGGKDRVTCTSEMRRRLMATSSCRRECFESIRVRLATGRGSSSFPRTATSPARARALSGAIACSRTCWFAPSSKLRARQAFAST